MANYKSYYNSDDPLNLYNGKSPFPTPYEVNWNGISKKPSTLGEKDSEQDEKNRLLQNTLLEQQNLQLQKNLAYLNRLMHPELNPSMQGIKEDVENDVAFAINPATGKLKNPFAAVERQLGILTDRKKEEEEFLSKYNNINSVGNSLLNLLDKGKDYEGISDNIKKLIEKDLLSRGDFKDAKDFQEAWNSLDDDEEKITLAISALGREYFKGDLLLEFIDSSDLERFDMLASYIKNNPYYETLASKHKKKINWGDNQFVRDWKAQTDYVTNRFLYGITGGYKDSPLGAIETYRDVIGGGALMTIGQLGNLAGNIVGSTGEYLLSRVEGMGKEEDIDAYIAKRADAYLEAKSLDYYNYINLEFTEEQKKEAIKSFDAQSLKSSKEYAAEIGNSLTDLSDEGKQNADEIKLKEYAKMMTARELYGLNGADLYVNNFWKNEIANKQTRLDKLLRTSGTFCATAVADVTAFAGVIANPLFMTIDHHGSTNPEDWTVDGEGYMDALVKRNPLLTWANNLQETGAWSKEGLEKYKNLGINQYLIYKTTDEENAFLSGNDVYDMIGLYGFTAATTLLSLGGSSVVKAAASSMGKAALKKAIAGGWSGVAARALVGKEGRQILKNALAKNLTNIEAQTLAKETAAKLAANVMYKGNLAVGAMMGTAEGALEAKSTYNTFMEDNLSKMSEEFDRRQQYLDNATNEDLKGYLLSKGEQPALVTRGGDGRSIIEYSPEQYSRARKELQESLDDAKKHAFDRVENNAADAAAANFISNSFINGALNVFMKEAVMSRDVREASRIMQGKNKLTDLVDVVKEGKGWKAVAKKAVDYNNKKNVWGNMKSMAKKALKTAEEEALEEYSQNISDRVARDAMLSDLNSYMATIFDKDSREAFLTDWMEVLNSGMNSLVTNSTDLENIKAGIFGGSSALIGGFSPAGIFSMRGISKEEKGFKNTAKWLGENLLNLYQGGIMEAYRENKEESKTAKRLVESTNAWLNSEKNQELLTHLGGAIGYKKALLEALLSGDDMTAHDSKLSMAVENAFMLLALKDTDYGKAMQLKIEENAELLDVVADDSNFDSDGNYIGNVTITQEGPVAEENWVIIALNAFKNSLGEASRNTSMTDREMLEKIGTNAKNLLELLNDVYKALKRVREIFKYSNIDPLAEQAFVHALVLQQNTRSRIKDLRDSLGKALDKETLDELDKEILKPSGLGEDVIDFLVEYGSLSNAEKELEGLKEFRNILSEKANNKRLSSQARSAARRKVKLLDRNIKALSIQVDKEKARQEAVAEPSQVEEGLTAPISLTQSVPTTFSAGDIAQMPEWLIAEILNNKKSYSEEQQKAIDDFITVVRKNLSKQNEDIQLTDEEVIKDYKDLNALLERLNVYDTYLTNYIENPLFLTTTAAMQREKERTRTLKHLYKEDLQIREGESVLDFKRRLDNKVLSLQLQGQYEDANILTKLINQDKDISKLHTNVLEVDMATKLYGIFHREELETKEFGLMYTALLTLVANSGMSMKEILEALSRLDTTSLVEVLLKTSADGTSILDEELSKRNLETFNLGSDTHINEGILAPTLLKLKDFVDFYVKSKETEEVLPSTKKLTTEVEASASREPKVPNNSKPKGQKSSIENERLGVLTPGLIEQTSPLGQFLSSKGVSQNLLEYDNKSNPNIQFAVIRDAQGPHVFAVLATTSKQEGKTVSINGINYKIIGVVDSSTSQTMTNLGLEAYNALMPHEEGRLISSNGTIITVQPNIVGEAKSKSDLAQETPVSLKTLLKNDANKIAGWLRMLMAKGKKVTRLVGEGENAEEKTSIKDLYGYTVELDDEQEASRDIEKFPIGNTTLGELLLNCDFSDPDLISNLIKLLKTNEYFKCYFDTWKDFDISSIKGTDSFKNIYMKLLGDFMYLGSPYIDIKEGELIPRSGQKDLNPRIEEGGYLLLDHHEKAEKREDLQSLRIAIPTAGDSNREMLALNALRQILANKDFFMYLKPQIGMNIIDNKSTPIAAQEREIRRLTGLIDADLLRGYQPTAIDRDFTIINPFFNLSSKDKSNDLNASQFDPKPKGVVKGGTVNVADGTIQEGNPESVRDKIKGLLNEAQKTAQSIVDRIVNMSKNVTQENSNSETYSVGETQHSRTTSIKHAFIGTNVDEFDASEDVATISHAYGNTIDAVLRAAMEILNKAVLNNNKYNRNELLAEVLKDRAFYGKTSIPNWTNYLMKKFLDLVLILHQTLVDKGWTVVPKDIKAFGTASVYREGLEIGKLPVAGTLDLLAYDREGKFHIIDIKTVHLTDNGENALDTNREAWETLVSTYQELLSQLNPDMEFGENYILPVFLAYGMPESAVADVEDDGMTVKNCTPTMEPAFKTSLKESYNLSDFLYQIDTLDFKGYEEKDLSESDRQRIIPKIAEAPSGMKEEAPSSETPPAGTGPAQQEATGSLGTTIEDVMDSLDIEFESKRTTRQAKFTEFINNHIAPVSRVKVGVMSKVKSIVKDLVARKDKALIATKELSNIFFNGDLNKLNLVLRGKQLTEGNYKEVLQSLKDYFSSYLLNKDKYSTNITKRFELSKAVYSFLKGETTQLQLEETLTKYNASMDSISELLEYMASPNREETAAKLIKKLEDSKAISQETYDLQMRSLSQTIESMQAKLDFLNTRRAEEMLKERISSVQKALFEGSYEEQSYSKSSTIEDLLTTKSGSYGAIKLLRGIATTTRNSNFRILANTLLREIQRSNLTIPIVIEDGNLNFVEGSTKDKVITLQKNSLDNYEHLERVLLHEMLHAVVEISPELRATLQSLLDKTILRMLRTTGNSIEEIKKQNYGLLNVDEFISEFFTNYAFQETLREIGTEDYGNIFEKIVGTIKEKFFGNKSLYSQITESMEVVLGSMNIEDTTKKTERAPSLDSNSFDSLSSELQANIKERGFTKEDYEDLTNIEKERLKICCS